MTDIVPAADTGLPAFDRRSLLGSAALASIVAATAAVPALAADHPDATLLELVAEVKAAEARYQEIDDIAEAQQIFRRFDALSPPVPQELVFDETRDTFEICYDRKKLPGEDIGDRWRSCYLSEQDIPSLRWKVAKWREYGTGRNVVDRAEKIIAALDVYAPARKRAEDESGVTAFHEESLQLDKTIRELARQIAATPALTSDGVGAKARAAATRWSSNPTWLENDLLPRLLAGQGSYADLRPEVILGISLVVDAMKLGAPVSTTAAGDDAQLAVSEVVVLST